MNYRNLLLITLVTCFASNGFSRQCRIFAKSVRINMTTGEAKVRGFYDPYEDKGELLELDSWQECYERSFSTLFSLSAYKPYKYSMGHCDIDISMTGDEPVDPDTCTKPIKLVYPFVYWNFDDVLGPIGNSWGYVNLYTHDFLSSPKKGNQAYSSRGERLDSF